MKKFHAMSIGYGFIRVAASPATAICCKEREYTRFVAILLGGTIETSILIVSNALRKV